MEKNKTYHGRYQSTTGKIIHKAPTYNFLAGGNWKTGFSKGVQQSGGEITEYEVLNPEMIDHSKFDYFYTFEVIEGKAKIIK